jgi:hypothetical protein
MKYMKESDFAFSFAKIFLLWQDCLIVLKLITTAGLVALLFSVNYQTKIKLALFLWTNEEGKIAPQSVNKEIINNKSKLHMKHK